MPREDGEERRLVARLVARLEGVFAKVHKSTQWRDYMTRNMYEDVWMGADEFARWLAAQQTELTQFLTEMGLAQKK